MSDRSLPARVPTEDQRERVTAELCEHFSAGNLELDLLEFRLAAVDVAKTETELLDLVKDLPELAAVAPAVVEPPKRRGWALALLGGNSRKGEWAPPRQLNAIALMGGVELDFRDARLAPGETHVTAVALMGGVNIVVPPGLSVTVRGLGLLGGVDQVEQLSGERRPNMPQLIVTAFACMGGVGIETRASKKAELLAAKRSEKRR